MNKKIQIIIISFIFLLAIFLRFCQVEERAVFYYDESYDALQARKIITERKMTLLGHPYSVSGTYQGPLYYYLIAPVLYFSNYNPVSAAIFIAIVNLLAVVLIFLISKKYFGFKPAFISLVLFSISPLIVEQARKSWYPGPIELLAPLIFLLLYKFARLKRYGYILVSGILTGAAMQFHIMSFPLIFLGFILCLKHKNFIGAICFIAGVLIGFSPLIIFEFRHEFFNSKMFFKYFQNSRGFGLSYFLKLLQFYSNLFNGIFTFKFPFNAFGVLMSLVGILKIWKEKNLFGKRMVKFVFFGSLIVPFATKEVLFHYIVVFHFVPVIIFGIGFIGVVQRLKNQKLIKTVFLISSVILILYFFVSNPIFQKKTWGILQSREASLIISSDVSKNKYKNFNVVLLDHGETRAWPIRYFLDVFGARPQSVELYNKSKIIYVVASDPELVKTIDVWELKSGGPFKIVKKWPIDATYSLYKLNYINL